MGDIEKKIKNRIRISALQNAVLTTVSISGLLLVSAVAPGILKFFKYSGLEKKLNLRSSTNNRSIDRLIQNGYLIFEEKNGKKFLRITESGRKILEKEKLSIPKKTKWDQKWRIVIFDIKERKRVLRDKLRNTLVAIGFL